MENTLQTIKELIRKGETEHSIDTFLDYARENARNYLDELIIISGAYTTSNQRQKLGLIKNDEHTLKVNNIHYSLLSIIGDIEKESSGVENTIFKKVYLSKLPITSNGFFGRESELDQLRSDLHHENINIISIIAWGGMGKSALINEFLNELSVTGFADYDYIFGWSFYNQGITEKRQTSSDEFFNQLIDYLGLGHVSSKSNWEKTSIIIEQVRRRKVFMILDGLEPLQYPAGELLGRIRDKNLSAFIKELHRYNKGKIIISSRLSISDIKSSIGKTVSEIRLGNLSKDSGYKILCNLGVKGAKREIENSVEELQGHPLSLLLLGNYLRVVYNGKIKKRKRIKSLYNEKIQGGAAREIISTYQLWFAGKPEINILNILGLFDRPIQYELFELFIKSPPINYISNQIQNMNKDEIFYLFHSLREVNLITTKEYEADIEIDIHPIIREYFQNDIKNRQKNAWKEAHKLLFSFYTNKPGKELPETFEELEPLFLSIYHGCQAELYEDSFRIYWERIKRKHKHFNTANLGLFGLDLSILSNFFEEKWNTPIESLQENIKAYVFYWAGFSLSATGLLKDAILPLKNALDTRLNLKQWRSVASIADNIAETHIPLGNLTEAKKYAFLSLKYARQAKDDDLIENKLCSVGNILHLMGEFEPAEKRFSEAEASLHKRKAKHKYLHLYDSYQYCCYLITRGRLDEVIERADATLRAEIGAHWTLDIALNKYCKGKALLKKAEHDPDQFSLANLIINEAVDELKTAGMMTYIAFGLILKAQIEVNLKKYEKARLTLAEAQEMIDTNDLSLLLVDYHLEMTRLDLELENHAKAAKNCRTSYKLMHAFGYFSKRAELMSLRSRLEKQE